MSTRLRINWRSSWVLSIGLVCAARLVGLALGGVLWQAHLIPTEITNPNQIYLSSTPLTGSISGWVLGPWQRHDALYYIEIAQHGYSSDPRTIVFSPLYPLLIRLLGWLLGGQYILAALLISSAASAGVLGLLYQFAARAFGPAAGRRAMLYLIFFATGYALISAYADALLLLLILLTIWLAQKEQWWLAGLAAFLAAQTRLQAVVLVIPVLYLYGRVWWSRKSWPSPGGLWAISAAPLAALTYSVYLTSQGLPSVLEVYRQYWHSVTTFPGTDLALALGQLLSGTINFQRGLALAFLLVFLALTVMAFRRLPLEYALYMTAMEFYVLIRHDLTGRPLLSAARHVLLLFPGFMLLSNVGRNVWVHRVILYLSFLLYLFMLGAVFMWGFPE